jgi:hypothetical protein
MLPPHDRQVLLQRRPDLRRQHRHAILLALAAPHHELIPVEVDVLHSQVKTLAEAQPGSVQQGPDDPHHPAQLLKDRADLVPAQHHWKPLRRPRPDHRRNRTQILTEHVTVEKEDGAERLILCGGTDAFAGRERREKCRDRCE